MAKFTVGQKVEDLEHGYVSTISYAYEDAEITFYELEGMEGVFMEQELALTDKPKTPLNIFDDMYREAEMEWLYSQMCY